MIDIKYIREDKEKVKENIRKKEIIFKNIKINNCKKSCRK